MTTATRIEVGSCDLGSVFIFARTNADGETWMVRAGNHTVGTYGSEDAANAVARALCGEQQLTNEFIEAAPSPAMEKYVDETLKKVNKK